MITVVFACVHNAGRSQMAAAWFELLADSTLARAISAGTRPAAQVHPEVVAAMREVGVELSQRVPRQLDDALAGSASLLVTMGCGESCPVVPGVPREDWPFEDPKGQSIERVRVIRDEIRERVRRLVHASGWASQRGPRADSPRPAK